MKNETGPEFRGILCGILAVILGCLFLPAELAFGTNNKGNNAVYNSSGPVGSAAFIDASVFSDVSTDICATLNGIISGTTYLNYPIAGAVVDARGINASNSLTTDGNMTCPGTPWIGAHNTNNPATILLPAPIGTSRGTITISQTWLLPNGSRIIGEVPSPQGPPGLAGNPTLRAISSGFTGSAMIQMGTSCPSNGCTGVSVEHVTLDVNNQDIDGIDNASAQDGSYVDDVTFQDVGQTGLKISAPNSGPYSNLNYSSYACATHCPACVEIDAATRGLHGITCIGDTTLGTQGLAAIYVSASNNTIEDVHVEGFYDGVEVEVGNAGPISNVVIANVTGAQSNKGPTINTVHICGPNPSSTFLPCTNRSGSISDVTISGVSDENNNTGQTSTAVQDDITNTSITPQGSSVGAAVALYVLGEAVGNQSTPTQYSRFSTSPSITNSSNFSTVVPTWGVGNTAAAGGCLTPGALYSNTGDRSGNAVYVCSGSPTSTWQSIP